MNTQMGKRERVQMEKMTILTTLLEAKSNKISTCSIVQTSKSTKEDRIRLQVVQTIHVASFSESNI